MKKFAIAVYLFGSISSVAQTVGELVGQQLSGPRSRRVNIAVVGDGYQASERALFITHLKTFSDAVVNKDLPFSNYSAYFNILGVFVASNESGADDPSRGITRDTYFGAAYNATITRLLTVNTTKVATVIRQHVPEFDLAFIIVNSSTYGGSGGSMAVANFTSPSIISHEVGHTFAHLGDEYEYAGSTPSETPNTTKSTVRNLIRWNHWILATTPVPTPETKPYLNSLGLFEGAAYSPTGWYRPKQNCRMQTNGVEFCEVCSEAYILSMYDKTSPIDSVIPSNKMPFVTSRPVILNVIPMKPSSHPLKVEWKVDGANQPSVTGGTFTSNLSDGRHTVFARVTDTTGVVRKDLLGLLQDSVTWTVDVSGGVYVVHPSKPSSSFPEFLNANQNSMQLVIPKAGSFKFKVLTGMGQVVESQAILFSEAGIQQFPWNYSLKAGLYFIEMESQGHKARRQFLIMK